MALMNRPGCGSACSSWLSFGRFSAKATPNGDPREGDAEISDSRLTPVVLDAATGEWVNLAIPGHPAFAIPSVWLDDKHGAGCVVRDRPIAVGGRSDACRLL
jgi:hypothetical protein